MRRSHAATVGILGILLAAWALLAGCRTARQSGAPKAPEGSYYRISGFYLGPIEEIRLGAGHDEVTRLLGAPRVRLKAGFKEPNRVKLADLPKFDEQWGWFENLGHRWVFFRKGRVVAAFAEWSDL